MKTIVHEKKKLRKENYSGRRISDEEFEQCTFIDCSFSRTVLTLCIFIDCTFINCDLSNVTLKNSQMNTAVFRGCKLLGVNFGECADTLFTVAFEECIMDYTSFLGKKMGKTSFTRCSLKHADFSDADLTNSVFEEADLLQAVFNKTILKGADFSSATNYSIDPELNKMKKAKFSLYGLPGLLSKYDIEIE